jgi:hypothetical protein
VALLSLLPSRLQGYLHRFKLDQWQLMYCSNEAMTKIPIASFLDATVGLDTTTLQALGFKLEDSPNLEGARLVVNNISLMPIQ